MDKPISVGDLVQVVRGHVCDLGKVARVEAISLWPHWWCDVCGHIDRGEVVAAVTAPGYGYPLSWLKRIPPLGQLEGVKKDEEITA